MIQDLELFNSLVKQLLEDEKQNPVVKPIPVDELYSRLDIALTEEGNIDVDFSESLRQIVLHTPRTATNLFFNQLFGGRNSKAVLGDLLAVMLNNSMYTYKVAGPQVGIEKEIINKSSELCGYGELGAGTIAPGGSMSNFMALIMARDAKNKEIRHHGVQGKYCLYTSENSHYSVPKNAAFAGIGRDQVRYIPYNEYGQMDVVELRKAIEKDIESEYVPFMVNATAGTTVLGAFDPIEEIAEVCNHHQIWLHVDGAYCGSVIFSEKYRKLVKGIELSDSFSYNAHKMLGTPLSCSVILTKHKQALYDSFSNDADYLYQTDRDDYNLGKTSLQCGRRNDALKFWTLWKSIGRVGLGELVDKQFELADQARSYVESHPDYTLYSYPDSISICFNYKDIPADQLCTKLYEQAELMVGFGQFKDETFVRLVTINYNNSASNINNFFERLEQFAEKDILSSTHEV